jgi:spermidine synthase
MPVVLLSKDMLIFSILLIALFFFSVMLFAFMIKGEELIYEKVSKYHHIMVYEEGSIRTLRLGDGHDDGKQSRIDLNDPDYLLLEYTRLVFAALFINERPLKVLIIGLGGGALPRAINRYIPDAEIDVVDIDPDVLEVAERYFMFKPGEMVKVHIGDGRLFIQEMAKNNSGKRYDMVILDAFNSNSIPRHLITKEFLKEVIQVLDPKGVVAANVLFDNRLFHFMLKTYRKVFKRCYLFMGGIAQNAVFISPGPDAPDINKKDIEERAQALQELYHFSFSMVSVARQFRPRCSPKITAKVITDARDA